MRLKEARKRAGLTAVEAGRSVGVSAQNVYNWEAGSYLPGAARLKQLARRYGCTVDELLADDQDSA